jgi:hypothetical protein
MQMLDDGHQTGLPGRRLQTIRRDNIEIMV